MRKVCQSYHGCVGSLSPVCCLGSFSKISNLFSGTFTASSSSRLQPLTRTFASSGPSDGNGGPAEGQDHGVQASNEGSRSGPPYRGPSRRKNFVPPNRVDEMFTPWDDLSYNPRLPLLYQEPMDPVTRRSWMKKFNRAQKGDYSMYLDEMLDDMTTHTVPRSAGPLYDIRTMALRDPQLKHWYDVKMPLLDGVRVWKESDPEGLLEAIQEPREPPPFKGAKKILRWELRMYLHASSNPHHPGNRKAKCRVFLRDLQKQTKLTYAALQHIVKICGARYNPNKGELTLTSEKYPHREDNRRHILRMLDELVLEGHRKHPAKGVDVQALRAQMEAERQPVDMVPWESFTGVVPFWPSTQHQKQMEEEVRARAQQLEMAMAMQGQEGTGAGGPAAQAGM